ncbi:ANR family transcriptional regulator [Vibrio astriarenae]|uniref:ANR family transcriptional regulator n=1 Tax=Vibrio astriarenae TaxID=1481923 RepID=UPI003735CA23
MYAQLYLDLANEASQLERDNAWPQAHQSWTRASAIAPLYENRIWSALRAEFCQKRYDPNSIPSKRLLNETWQVEVRNDSPQSRLSWVRNRLNLTYEQIKNASGVSVATIRMIETGDTEHPTNAVLSKISMAMNVYSSWLSEGVGVPFLILEE